MRIDFQSSGGYIPLELVYHVDTEDLPSDEAQSLTQMVKESGIFSFEPAAGQGPMPDVTTYRLSVRDDARAKSVTVTDLNAGSLHALLTRLRKLAMEQRR